MFWRKTNKVTDSSSFLYLTSIFFWCMYSIVKHDLIFVLESGKLIGIWLHFLLEICIFEEKKANLWNSHNLYNFIILTSIQWTQSKTAVSHHSCFRMQAINVKIIYFSFLCTLIMTLLLLVGALYFCCYARIIFSYSVRIIFIVYLHWP